jgi:hypothetical protein
MLVFETISHFEYVQRVYTCKRILFFKLPNLTNPYKACRHHT